MLIKENKVYRTRDGRYVIIGGKSPYLGNLLTGHLVGHVEATNYGWVKRSYLTDGRQYVDREGGGLIVDDVGDEEAAVVRAEFAMWAASVGYAY